MEAFFGSWQLCQKKNFEEYLKAIGEQPFFFFFFPEWHLLNVNVSTFFNSEK